MRFSASWAAKACDGTLTGPDSELCGASFDTRSIKPGELFIAVRGDRDGHEFVSTAFTSGAGACLVAADWSGARDQGGTYLEVDDPVVAIGRIAGAARDMFNGEVVGVTGSVGKTTTKELIRLAVSSCREVHASSASFNNDLGVPVSILSAPESADVWVLEMGMRGFGEIARLCRIAKPTIGVVTAVASAHSERVGGIEGVAKAKSELIAALDENGIAILNADDPLVAGMANLSAARVITFGMNAGADTRIEETVLGASGCASATVRTPWGAAPLEMHVPGAHIAIDAAAAVAVAGHIGCDIATAAANVSSFTAVSGRMEVYHLGDGCTLIDDSYNANPSSMEAALRTLASISAENRIAVLGAMAEISDPHREHARIQDLAESLGIRVVVLEDAPFPQGGVTVTDAIAIIRDGGANTAVLVKGSRAARTERVVNALLAP